jgi:hypothetical protein
MEVVKDKQKCEIDAFATDYADKLITAKKDEHTHTAMGEIYEEHRLTAVDWKAWAFTASQKKAGSVAGRGEADDASHSTQKGHVTDVMWGLEVLDDGDTINFHNLKNRHGRSQFTVGPLPTAFHVARISACDVHARVDGSSDNSQT